MAGGIMYPEENIYCISLDESHLKKIKEGEEIKTDLLVPSAKNILDYRDLPVFRDITIKNIKKELIISLLNNGINNNLQIEGLDEEGNSVSLSKSRKLKIQICEQLIDSILSKKEGHYECSYYGNTINFYVYDDTRAFCGKEFIDEELKTYRELYNNSTDTEK